MLEIYLAAFLGLGLVGLALGDEGTGGDSSDDDDTPFPEPHGTQIHDGTEWRTGGGDDILSSAPGGTSGATLYSEGGDDLIHFDGDSSLIHAGTGNDTITATGDLMYVTGGMGNDDIRFELSRSDVAGGLGHDTLTGSITGGNVYGADGDDLLVLNQVHNSSAHGGDGNDTITATDLNRGWIYGDHGDDLLRIDMPDGVNGWVSVEGGAGNDHFDVHMQLLNNTDSVPGAALVGDAGADTFEITLNHDTPAPGGIGARALHIEDFDPSEDQILINLPEDPDMVFSHAEITPAGIDDYQLALHYDRLDMATASFVPYVEYIRVSSETPLTLNHITITDAPAAAA